MTVTVEANKRVMLPIAEPGERFDLQVSSDGIRIILTRLDDEPARAANVRIEKRRGFSVGVLDEPINEDALKHALHEFP